MKRHLESLGYEITVITTSAYGRLPDDSRKGIFRSPDLVSAHALRRLLRRPALQPPRVDDARNDKPASALLTSIVVPDLYAVSWVPAAIQAARRIVREQGAELLVTSSPKDSTHLLGLALQRTGIAWVADFRDGWTFESTRPPFPTGAQRALDRKLEAAVVGRADAVTVTSEALATDFRRRLGTNPICITNGWDPELVPSPKSERSDSLLGPQRPGAVRLVYTGSFTGTSGAGTDRDPVPFLEALELLASTDPKLAGRIELVVAGRTTERDKEILLRFEHLGMIRHIGSVSRQVAVSIQRSADVLVVTTGASTSNVPMKLLEYLAAGRPILHLGRQGAASDILERTGAGLSVPYDDPKEVAEQLRRIACSEFDPDFTAAGIEQYSYPYVAERMAEVIAQAVAGRRAAHS